MLCATSIPPFPPRLLATHFLIGAHARDGDGDPCAAPARIVRCAIGGADSPSDLPPVTPPSSMRLSMRARELATMGSHRERRMSEGRQGEASFVERRWHCIVGCDVTVLRMHESLSGCFMLLLLLCNGRNARVPP